MPKLNDVGISRIRNRDVVSHMKGRPMKKLITTAVLASVVASGALAGSLAPAISDRPVARPDDPCATISVMHRDGSVAYKVYKTAWLCFDYGHGIDNRDDNDTKRAEEMKAEMEYDDAPKNGKRID